MTAQEHIEAIGRAIIQVEAAVKVMQNATQQADQRDPTAKAMRKATEQAEKSLALLHARLERAQKAYMATRDGKNIVAFSGGTDKPPVTDPDKPVKP